MDTSTTMRALLDLWQRGRNPEVAAVIARFGAAHESPGASAVRDSPKVKQEAWLEGAAQASLVDRGAWLAALLHAPSAKVKKRLEAIAGWEPDPRTSDLLNAMIEEPPWISTGARVAWTQAFRRMKEVDDPRTRALAQAFTASSVSGYEAAGVYLEERLTSVAERISSEVHPLTDAERSWLEEVAATVPEPRALRPVAEILGEIRESPEDLGFRLILSDALQEIGDPRGELIALQHQVDSGTADRKVKARIKKLLATHHDHLLGAWAPVSKKKNLVWQLGFPYAIDMKGVVHANETERALQSPLASTIVELSGPGEVLARPELKSLRRASVDGLDRLLAPGRTLPFTYLQVWENEMLASVPVDRFPDLEVLEIRRWLRPDHRPPAIDSPLGRAVAELRVACGDPELGARFLEGLLSQPDRQNLMAFLVNRDDTTRGDDWLVRTGVARGTVETGWQSVVVRLQTRRSAHNLEAIAGFLPQTLEHLHPERYERLEFHLDSPLTAALRKQARALVPDVWVDSGRVVWSPADGE